MHAERERAESAGIEDARAREHLGIARAGILRQVAELAGALDLAVGGQQIAREHLRERRLAGAVAADETDLVAVRHAERHVRHEDAGAHADLEVVHGEHSECPFRSVDGYERPDGPASQYRSPWPQRLPVRSRSAACRDPTGGALVRLLDSVQVDRPTCP